MAQGAEPTITVNGTTFSNNNAMPFELAAFNAYQSTLYTGGKAREGKVSATAIIGALKPLIYAITHAADDTPQEVSTLTASSRGTALHKGLEEALIALDSGYIVEYRLDREVNGWKVSGELDVLTPDKQIKDLKTTSSYILSKLKAEMETLDPSMSIEEMSQTVPTYYKYVMQLSIYKYLLNDPEVKPYASILFMIFHQGFEGFPLNSEQTFPLFPNEAVEEFLFDRIQSIKDHIKDGTLPNCTDVERGKTEPSYKLSRYSANTTKWATVRGSKFNNASDFAAFVQAKGKIGDKEIIDEAKYFICDNWCKWSHVCTQHDGD